MSVSATSIQRAAWYSLFIFWKQFNYIIFRASDLHFITIAAALDDAALLMQKLHQ